MSRYRTFAPIDAIRKITVVRNSNSLVSLVNSLIESNSVQNHIYIYIYFDEEQYSTKGRYLFYRIIFFSERDRMCTQTVYFAKGIVSLKNIIVEHYGISRLRDARSFRCHLL